MVEPGLMVVMADTSYSDMKAADNRGRAVSEVQLLDNGQVRVHGQLSDCRRLCYSLPDGIGEQEPKPPEMVGWDLPPMRPGMATVVGSDVSEMIGKDGFFVKAFLESESEQSYMLQHVNGFFNKYVYLRPNEVMRIFKAHREVPPESPSDDSGHDGTDTEPSPRLSVASGSVRQAQLTMHMVCDEDGSEVHEYAMKQLAGQMAMFKDDEPRASQSHLPPDARAPRERLSGMSDIVRAVLQAREWADRISNRHTYDETSVSAGRGTLAPEVSCASAAGVAPGMASAAGEVSCASDGAGATHVAIDEISLSSNTERGALMAAAAAPEAVAVTWETTNERGESSQLHKEDGDRADGGELALVL